MIDPGIAFKPFLVEDKETVENYLRKDSSLCLGAFTFSSLVSWENLYRYQWAVVDETLLLKLTNVEEKVEHLMLPFGAFPIDLQNKIIRYAQSLSYKLMIYGVSDEFIYKYPEFVSYFEKAEIREFDNYIYLTESLALLKGREFQNKRNLINQFEANNTWTCEPISEINIPDCIHILNTIYNTQDLEADFYLSYEVKALNFVLKHFDLLMEEGILIRVNGSPVAFSIYEQLNTSTYVVHFEKAMKEYKGLYQLVNRETAKIILLKGFKYINREEDLGIEGLRKSKLSYHPIALCPSIALVYRGEPIR
jgi:uncharacterized protein